VNSSNSNVVKLGRALKLIGRARSKRQLVMLDAAPELIITLAVSRRAGMFVVAGSSSNRLSTAQSGVNERFD
jgi:hypothetical protein